MNNVFHKNNLKEKQISVQENKFEKDCQKDNVQFLSKNNLKQNIKCCLCSKSHRLTNCYQFLKQSLEERKGFVLNRKLCKNSLSKGHQLDACPPKFTYQKDGCSPKHHTLFYENKTNELVSNKLESSNSKTSPSTSLQIITITLINGKMKIKRNALLDTGSDSTFIITDIAK